MLKGRLGGKRPVAAAGVSVSKDLEANIRFKVETQRKLCERWAQHCRNTAAREMSHQLLRSFKTKSRETKGGKPNRKLIVATGSK